jgi:5-methylcytosine-specific restriction protein B
VAADPVQSIFGAWSRGKSALLYGPPGTGKTRVLSELLKVLDAPETPIGRVGLDMSDSRNPFKSMSESSSEHGGGLPKPIQTKWLTFHQSMSYEDFVIGLRPVADGGQIGLVPHAGALLESIAELQNGSAGSVVIFIDEINRGNAAKIFGEFLTFLDFDYRETEADGTDNSNKIPLPIRHLSHDGSHYGPVTLSDGSEASLSYPAYFPRHLYVVATMNSVDRTAIPIDSALARRFERIDIRPNSQLLADTWDVDFAALPERAATPAELTPLESAVLIIERLNHAIAENFGPDFELGHGLLLGLKPQADASTGWVQLAQAWDRIIYPQIEDRFSGRVEELAATLRVEEFSQMQYAWKFRQSLTGETSDSVLAPVSLTALDPDLMRSSLQLLASRSSIE